MKRVGSGTQKVEQELFDLFPKAKVLRMDADTVGALREFEERKFPSFLARRWSPRGWIF